MLPKDKVDFATIAGHLYGALAKQAQCNMVVVGALIEVAKITRSSGNSEIIQKAEDFLKLSKEQNDILNVVHDELQKMTAVLKEELKEELKTAQDMQTEEKKAESHDGT